MPDALICDTANRFGPSRAPAFGWRRVRARLAHPPLPVQAVVTLTTAARLDVQGVGYRGACLPSRRQQRGRR